MTTISLLQVFPDIMTNGLEAAQSLMLAQSDTSDSVLCCCVQYPFIFLGTYGQELLIYCEGASPVPGDSVGTENTEESLPDHWRERSELCQYSLRHRTLLPDPVYSIYCCDALTHQDVVVFTSHAVFVLQESLSSRGKRVFEALNQLTSRPV